MSDIRPRCEHRVVFPVENCPQCLARELAAARQRIAELERERDGLRDEVRQLSGQGTARSWQEGEARWVRMVHAGKGKPRVYIEDDVDTDATREAK